jgi:hypothetical protein
MTTRLIVTTSWDDGYPADRRVGEVLAKHRATGTFYVPTRNAEGRPVLERSDVAALAGAFEIGGHSRDHVVLTELPLAEAKTQVSVNKADLEQITGKRIRGFCYVRGRFNNGLADIVKEAGFDYARTVENFHTSAPKDRYRVPTTIQLYPHTKTAYLKMLVRGALTMPRAGACGQVLGAGDILSRIDALANRSQQEGGGYFHLWGHSWELEALDLWSTLDAVLARLAAIPGVEFLTNGEAVDRLLPAPA